MSRIVTVLRRKHGGKVWALGATSQAAMNTTGTNDLTEDGFSWPSVYPIKVDAFGKMFGIFQRVNAGSKSQRVVVSNDGGATWVDLAGLTQGNGVVRGSAAYDATHDLLHVLWDYQGIGYRNYSFTRDGSNNITGITQNGSLVFMDDQNGTLVAEHANLLLCTDVGGAFGRLVAMWGMGHAGTGCEVRCSICDLGSASTTAATLGNWATPDGAASDTSGIGGTAVGVAYRKVFSAAGGTPPVVYLARKQSGTHAKDLYICHSTGSAISSDAYKFTRFRWNAGASNWSTGLTTETTISNVIVSGTQTGGGWASIHQNGTAWVEDTTRDTMTLGLARWLNNTDGSTVSLAIVDNTDAVSLVDVYKAGGLHTYMPGIAIARDVAKDILVTAYAKTTTMDIWLTGYRGTSKVVTDVLALDRVDIDLPILIDGATLSGRVPVITRNQTGLTTATPYFGQYASNPWQ